MCGVLGILGKCPLVRAKRLLLLLAHRGQDAAGLLWPTDGGFTTAKALGSPQRVVVPDEAPEVVLGSTRYPTYGRRITSEDDLDQCAGPFASGRIAISHNGNITNLRRLTDREYGSDSQFIAERLDMHLSETGDDLVEAVRRLEDELDGAYSIAGIHRGRLFAMRDPRGFKPLVFGRKDNTAIVASESTVFDMQGVSLERDIYPGELIIFSPDGGMESHSISQDLTHSHCFFEYVYFAQPSARIENQLVYDVRFRLGRALALCFKKMDLEMPDYVVPIPDTSRPAAQALAEELGVPMREIILKNRYLGRTFILQSQHERNDLAKWKYLYLDDKIRGKTLLIVDDSIVRGTTARRIVDDLRQRGASKVYFAATCPPQTDPCYYGIDISTGSELIASNTDVPGIETFIGADALIYQDMDGLINAIGLRDLCLACLGQEYPTEYARRIHHHFKGRGLKPGTRDYERELD